ncbi:MAG: hypothetical protein PHH08_00170 [Candidatus ainarchaeum sp.]|nr:hypothetical protein [Candidatus ainarchaeum sp.]
MNKNQVIALAIGILMLSSTIGFAFMSLSGQAPAAANTGDTPVPPASEIKYSAKFQPAKVVEIMPLIKIFGYTSEYDIQKIDSAIAGISGVTKVTSVFGNTAPPNLTYIAEISFSRDFGPETVVGEIKSRGILQGVDGYALGVVDLQKKIVFKSENADLNLTKEYEFADTQSPALVGFADLKGDDVLVTVSAVFAGSKLVDLMSIEEQNITAAPSSGTQNLELSIVSLEPSLVFSGKAFFSAKPDSDALKAKIGSIADVNWVELGALSIAPKLTLSGPLQISEEQVHDLNVFILSLNPQDVSFVNQGLLEVSIPFNDDANLADAKARLALQLKAMDLNSVSIGENSGELFGSVSLMRADSNALSGQLRQLLESFSLQDIAIMQPARLFMSEVADSNANAVYPVDSNSVNAQVKAGHAIGDKVKANILYYIVRKKIAFIAAEEEK